MDNVVKTAAAELNGYQMHLFKDQQRAHLYQCAICHKVARNPCELSCGDADDTDHAVLFCEACLSSYLALHDQQCPINSKHRQVQYMQTRLARKQINLLVVYCQNRNRNRSPVRVEEAKEALSEAEAAGCSWHGALSKLSAHLKVCKYAHRRCSLCNEHCVESSMEQHNKLNVLKHIQILSTIVHKNSECQARHSEGGESASYLHTQMQALQQTNNKAMQTDIQRISREFNEWKIAAIVEQKKKELQTEALQTTLQTAIDEQKTSFERLTKQYKHIVLKTEQQSAVIKELTLNNEEMQSQIKRIQLQSYNRNCNGKRGGCSMLSAASIISRNDVFGAADIDDEIDEDADGYHDGEYGLHDGAAESNSNADDDENANGNGMEGGKAEQIEAVPALRRPVSKSAVVIESVENFEQELKENEEMFAVAIASKKIVERSKKVKAVRQKKEKMEMSRKTEKNAQKSVKKKKTKKKDKEDNHDGSSDESEQVTGRPKLTMSQSVSGGRKRCGSTPLPVAGKKKRFKPPVLKRTKSMLYFHTKGLEWYHPKQIHYEMYHPRKATEVWVSQHAGSVSKVTRYPCCGSANEESLHLVLANGSANEATIERENLPDYWFDEIHLGCKKNTKRNTKNMSYFLCCDGDILSRGCKQRYICCKTDASSNNVEGCKVGWGC